MKYCPYSYQTYSIEFIKKHPLAVLMLDMGLGKTSIVLSAINDLLFDSFEIHKVLVIAPLRVARDVWAAELQKWDHLKDLTFSVVVGTDAERREALRKDVDIYITNRENVDWLVNKSYANLDVDMLVVDELSSFKNNNTNRFRALMKIRGKFKRVVGLTGTPATNGLMDLWSEYMIIDRGLRLGKNISAYRRQYFYPGMANGNVVYNYIPKPNAEKEIYKKIENITISMKASDYLKMPELIVSERSVSLAPKEKEKYDVLKKQYILTAPDGEITAVSAAALTNKLVQLSNGAVYDDNGKIIPIHTRKLDALEDLIEAANGKPVLVAYWFKHDFDRISERLDKAGIPYMKLDSADSIERWNRKEIPVGLIHPESAGHGLNLQDGGNSIIWFSIPWSLELYSQTNARLWRQGQTESTVVVQHIITAGTIDERILRVLKTKDNTQAALIAAVKATIAESLTEGGSAIESE